MREPPTEMVSLARAPPSRAPAWPWVGETTFAFAEALPGSGSFYCSPASRRGSEWNHGAEGGVLRLEKGGCGRNGYRLRHLTDLEREILGQRLLHLQLHVRAVSALKPGWVASTHRLLAERPGTCSRRRWSKWWCGCCSCPVGQGDGDAGNHRPGCVVDMPQDGAAGLRQQRGTCQKRETLKYPNTLEHLELPPKSLLAAEI